MRYPKVKLITPWNGPLPEWLAFFRDRLARSFVEWELVRTDLEEMNALAAKAAGVPCRKEAFYNVACDTRPLYAAMFAAKYAGYDFWGWCDTDIVLGDLNALLPPLLESHDVISGERHASGPFTLLRNCPETINLWRQGAYAEVLAEPEYMNWDETGFAPEKGSNANPCLDKMLRESKLRLHFDDRNWVESAWTLPNGAPSRCCALQGERLLEIPTGRELLFYHFTLLPKTWPLPNRFPLQSHEQRLRLRQAPPEAPIIEESPAYWARRLALAQKGGLSRHRSVLDCSWDDWQAYQRQTADILGQTLRPGQSVLDAGCGYGALRDCLKSLPFDVDYAGVDYCSEMIAAAADAALVCGDIRALPFPDQSFDWVVCRNLEGTMKTLVSFADWRRAKTEMLRVGKRLLLISGNGQWRVVR